MNIDWMRQKLEDFLALCEQYEATRVPAGDYDTIMKPILDKIDYALPTVQQIIGQLDPNLLTDEFGKDLYSGGLGETVRQTRLAIAVLHDREEWKINLAPDAPSLSADKLHPNIWDAAATIWETGEYELAAQAACVSLTAHIKTKASSHLNDRELVTQVFTAEPPTPSQSRLHLPGHSEDENWRSRQQGLHLVAQGAFAGIRNIAAHSKAVGPSTRRWSISPFSQSLNGGLTRPIWCRLDHGGGPTSWHWQRLQLADNPGEHVVSLQTASSPCTSYAVQSGARSPS